jgi:hypothetical protein
MQTDCNAAQLIFEGFEGRRVVGAFDGGAVTSNAGATLLREADLAIGLTAKVARCFRDGRAEELVVHRIETLVAQRVHAIALGYEDINDHDELRHDPVLSLLSDALEPKRADVASLAGKSTLNRLEHGLKSGVSRYHKISVIEEAMEQVFLDLYVAAHNSAPKRIVLDLDATDDPLHGHQEGRFYHGYYRCYCYLPLYIFDGRHLLVAKLRKADIDASAGAKEEIARIVTHVREAWPQVEIWLRADSGFARDELMSWCEENRVEYVFGLARNQRLEPMIASELADAKAIFTATAKPARIFKELDYRTRAAPGPNRNRDGQRHGGIDPPQAVQDWRGSDGKRPPHQAGLRQRLSDEGCVLACAPAPARASRATRDRCRGLTAINPTEDQLQRNSPEPAPAATSGNSYGWPANTHSPATPHAPQSRIN